MPQILNIAEADFEGRFAAFLAQKRETSDDVDRQVRDIVSAVRTDGDSALLAFTKRFDNVLLTPDTLRVAAGDIDAAVNACQAADLEALELAHNRIRSHHQRQLPQDDVYTDDLGAVLGTRWTAVESAGLYAPGGMASYPSSVLMNVVPASVAGVPRLVMVVPAPRGELNPLILAAAKLAGVHEVYRVGGAQAVAALAYGTETISPVVKIVGPGNAYVATAKRQVFGTVGIDSIAGPSEVLIIADRNNNPEWIAADLLAQAEHDVDAQSILMTDDADFGAQVIAAVEQQLETLPRQSIAAESWNTLGAVIVVADISQAPALADRIAAEHLQIAVDDPDALAAQIRNAGAVFLGALTPEVIGDYVGGTNHVLPTARSARYASGLGVLDFMKRTSVLKLDRRALGALGPAAVRLAEAEGLDAHARSVAMRLDSA